MASRENQSRTNYYLCPTHGEVAHAVAKDGGKLGERMAPPKVAHTDIPEEAMKMNQIRPQSRRLRWVRAVYFP